MTTGIYIGSAIYTPGVQEVMKVFGVSQVAATLGLCLFVAGYGLGPVSRFLCVNFQNPIANILPR